MKKLSTRLLSAVLALVLIAALFVSAPAVSAEETSAADTADEITEKADEPLEARAMMKQQIFVTAPSGISGDEIDPEDPSEEDPTDAPTEDPTGPPTDEPTAAPTDTPTQAPTVQPTQAPTQAPSNPKPAKVSGVKRTSSSTSKITLKWNAVKDVTGYNIYWKDKSTGSALKTFSVKTNTFTLYSLSAGHTYEFKICAYVTKNNNKYEGDPVSYTTATNPAKVTGLTLVHSSKTIDLKWTKNNYATGYVIYREDSSTNGQFKKYKTVKTNIFSDTKVSKGRAYYYRVLAYKTVGSQTLYGEYAQIKTVCGLCAPSNNGSKTILSRVNLQWTSNKYAKGYDIYYSTDNKNFKALKGSRYGSTDLLSVRLTPNKTYHFRIYPYKYVGKNNTKVRGTYLHLKYKVTSGAYGKKVGKTYVEINIKRQYMWFYKNGKLLVETPIVTGNYNSMDTPKGYHSVQNKASPCTLSGPGYSSYVQYWIAFIGSGYGIHDASWRSTFGGSIYKGDGSHGCVNTPLKNVKKIYQNISVGTPVIVY